jgi:uncharacterized membrane protein
MKTALPRPFFASYTEEMGGGTKREDFSWAVGVGLLCAWLYQVGIGRNDFLWNEPLSVSYSAYSWPEMLALFFKKPPLFSPDFQPLYFVLLKVWRLLAGSSVVALRSFSVAVQAGAIGAFFVLVRRAGLPRGGALLAALLLAVDPKMLWMAQEIRWYSLSLLFSVLLMIQFLNLYRRPQTSVWPFLIIGMLGQLTFYFFSPLFAFCLLVLLAQGALSKRAKRNLLLGSVLVTLVCNFPSLPSFLEYRFQLRQGHDPTNFSRSHLEGFVQTEFLFFNAHRILMAFAAALTLVAVCIKKSLSPELRWLGIFTGLSMLAVLGLKYFLHLDEMEFRYISNIYPIFMLCAALGVQRWSRLGALPRPVLGIALVLIVAQAAREFYQYQHLQHPYISIVPAVDALEKRFANRELPFATDRMLEAKGYVLGLWEARVKKSYPFPRQVSAAELRTLCEPDTGVILFEPPPKNPCLCGQEFSGEPWPHFVFVGEVGSGCRR